MCIEAIEFWSHDMALAEPYEIAYEKVEVATNVFLQIKTSGGLIGWGCAAPDREVTGETPKTVLSDLRDTVEPFLKGKNPFRQAIILEPLKRMLAGKRSLLAAVDMALHDLLGKKAGLPLWKLLGGYRNRVLTSVTLGIQPLDSVLSKVRGHLDAGFRSLKIKGGKNVEADIEIVRRVREVAGPQIGLRFDANQGYSLEQALKFVDETKGAGLELLEQPTQKDEPELMGRVIRRTQIPVMADESAQGLESAFKLVKGDWADIINLKLMKVGGIAESLQIDAVARSAGVETMVGCMDEAALAIAAGLSFALARPNVEYADLDGHLDLLDDPTRGAVRLENGYLYPNDLPGLGVEL